PGRAARARRPARGAELAALVVPQSGHAPLHKTLHRVEFRETGGAQGAFVSPTRSRLMISKARLATFIAVPLILLGGALAYAHQQGHHGPGDGQHMDRHLDQMAKMLTTIG